MNKKAKSSSLPNDADQGLACELMSLCGSLIYHLMSTFHDNTDANGSYCSFNLHDDTLKCKGSQWVLMSGRKTEKETELSGRDSGMISKRILLITLLNLNETQSAFSWWRNNKLLWVCIMTDSDDLSLWG